MNTLSCSTTIGDIRVFTPVAITDKYNLTMSLSWLRTLGMKRLCETRATYEGYLRKLKRGVMLAGGIRRINDEFYTEFSRLVLNRMLRMVDREFDEIHKGTVTFLQRRFKAQGIEATRGECEQLVHLFVQPGFEIRGLNDGTSLAPNLPIVQTNGNLIQCQISETWILSCLNAGTGIISKAFELYMATGGAVPIMEGGARRTDPDASVWTSYYAYLGGCASTSNSCAGERFCIPDLGTMAHAYVMSFDAIVSVIPDEFVDPSDSEYCAFDEYVNNYGPQNSILLVDTYDVYACIDKVLRICRERGPVKGIRLDSGDVFAQARFYRAKLDEAGFTTVKVYASNGFDTEILAQIVSQKVPIDGVLVGERLSQIADNPVTGCVYKMVELDGKPVAKFADGKIAYPYRKVVYKPEGYNMYVIEKYDDVAESVEALEKMNLLRPLRELAELDNPGIREWNDELCIAPKIAFSDEISDAYHAIGKRHHSKNQD